MANDATDKLNCSFCGKVQDDVKKLIAGPSVYICNECVDLCNDIIEEEIKGDEDVTLEDVHRLMEEGYTSFEELKRLLRIGMGPCQGNTCGQLLQKEISKFMNTPLNQVKMQKVPT